MGGRAKGVFEGYNHQAEGVLDPLGGRGGGLISEAFRKIAGKLWKNCGN